MKAMYSYGGLKIAIWPIWDKYWAIYFELFTRQKRYNPS